MRGARLLTGLLLGSCGGTETLWIGSPPTSGMRSMLIAVDQGGVLGVSAASLDPDPGGLVFPIEKRSAGPVRFEVLLYARTLAELGLSAGAITEAKETDPFRAVPSTAEVYWSQVEPSSGTVSMAWTRSGAPSSRMSAFRMPKPAGSGSDCAEFTVSVRELQDPGHGTIAVALDRDRALLATDQRAFYVVTRTEVRRLDVSIAMPFASAVLDENGVLWIGGTNGEVWRAELRDTLTGAPVTTSPSKERIRAIAGDGEELFTAGDNGAVERYSAGQWTLVKRFPDPTTSLSNRAVSVVRRGEAVAVSPVDQKVVRYSEGVITEERTSVLEGLTSVAHVPGFGTVAGTSNGGLLMEQGGMWSPMAGNMFRLWVTTIEPYEDGFVFGGPFGNFGQYRPGTGFCPLAMPAAFSVNFVVNLGGDLLLFGSNANTPRTAVVLMERKR